MSRRRAALGLCALLGIPVLVIVISRVKWRGDEAVVVSPQSHRQGSTPGPEKDAAPETSARDGEPAATDPASDAIRGWTLRGRLLRYGDSEAAEADTPAAGALIRLALHPESDDPRPDFPGREVRSGPDGKFVVEGVPGNASYRLDVDADGCALRAISFELPETQGGDAKDIPDIALEEPVRLVVNLRGPGGQPVEDGKVSAHLSQGFNSTKEESLSLWEEGSEAAHRGGGEYVLERAPRGSSSVDASAPGFVDGWRLVPLPLARPLEMRLRRGLRLTGNVRSSAGEPLEGAEVIAEDCVTGQSVRTTADGKFELKDLPDTACLVTAIAVGFGYMQRKVEPGLEEIDFVLAPEAVIAGRVLSSESREPIANAEIRGEWAELVTTDSAGTFEIRKLPAGTYRPHVFHGGHVPRALDELQLEEGERAEGIVVLLEEGLSVTGRVIGARDGPPLARASVSARWSPSEEGAGPDIDQDTLTDEHGAFTLAGLVEGEYTVSVLADGYCRLTRGAVLPKDDPEGWTFALEKGGSIRGRVLYPDGRPAPRATVHLGCPKDDPSKVHVPVRHREGSPADRLGRYLLEDLPAFERYCLLVTDGERRFAPAWMCEIAVGPGEQVELPEMRLRGVGSILGRVLDSAGNPVRGVAVRADPDLGRERMLRWNLLPEGTTLLSFYSYTLIPDQETSTDSQGEYEFRWLLGHYEIEVNLQGHIPPASKWVDVGEGARLENIDFILPGGVVVSGQVLDSAGLPLEGAAITVSRPCSGGAASATTDADGRFEVRGLSAGRGSIIAAKPQYAARLIRCDIPSAGNVLSLDRQPVVTGRIAVPKDMERPPVCEVRTRSRADSGWFYSATSDGTGRFTVPAPPGMCLIGAEAEGFLCHPVKLDLKPGERREVVLEVEGAGIVEVELDFEGREERFPVGTFVTLESAGAHPVPLREDVSYYGGCTFDSAPPGEMTLVACVPGRGLAREGITVTAGETTEVKIEVPRVQGLFGIVTRRTEPVRGGRVAARGAGAPLTTRTSSSGFYEIRDLEPGAYEVTFEEEGASRPPIRKRTIVPEGGAQRLDAELGAAIVSGLVTSRGEPVPGARVIADNWVGEPWSEAEADATGAWSLELEVPGEYVIQAFRGQEAAGPMRNLVLEEGQAEARLDIEIEED